MAKLKKEQKNKKKRDGMDVFEISCELMRENWRYCLEIVAIFFIFLAVIGGVAWLLVSMKCNFWLGSLVALIACEVLMIFVVGKNKNLLSIVKDLGGGRYPLWLIEYAFSAWRLLMVKVVIWAPLVSGVCLGLFFWFISPSIFWMCLCLILGITTNAWLQLRLSVAEIALCANQKMKIDEGMRQSFQLTKNQGGHFLSVYIINVLFFVTAGVFLPVIGVLLLMLVVNFEKAVIFKRLNE